MRDMSNEPNGLMNADGQKNVNEPVNSEEQDKENGSSKASEPVFILDGQEFRTVSELSSDILSLLENVNATLGAEGGDVPAFTGSLDDLDGFDDIAIEIRDMTNKVHADLIQMEREEIEAREAQRKAGANGMQGGNLVIEP